MTKTHFRPLIKIEHRRFVRAIKSVAVYVSLTLNGRSVGLLDKALGKGSTRAV